MGCIFSSGVVAKSRHITQYMPGRRFLSARWGSNYARRADSHYSANAGLEPFGSRDIFSWLPSLGAARLYAVSHRSAVDAAVAPAIVLSTLL